MIEMTHCDADEQRVRFYCVTVYPQARSAPRLILSSVFDGACFWSECVYHLVSELFFAEREGSLDWRHTSRLLRVRT